MPTLKLVPNLEMVFFPQASADAVVQVSIAGCHLHVASLLCSALLCCALLCCALLSFAIRLVESARLCCTGLCLVY